MDSVLDDSENGAIIGIDEIEVAQASSLKSTARPQKLRVISHKWRWNGVLGKRFGAPSGIILHHACARVGPDAIHKMHLKNGWRGIAYHYYVRRNGQVHQGRPEWAIGGHAVGAGAWIGICAEGNYDSDKTMPPAQLASLKLVVKHLRGRYGSKIKIKKHKDMPKNSTACPGRYYPFRKVTGK